MYVDEAETEILFKLLRTIKNKPDSCLISYSCIGFDKNVILRALERNGLDTELFTMYPHYDLCQMIRSNYIFPHNNFKLKELGAFLGYYFQHQDFDGLMVALAYHNHIESNEPLDHKFFEYNEDDVRSTAFLYDLIINNEIDSEPRLIIKDGLHVLVYLVIRKIIFNILYTMKAVIHTIIQLRYRSTSFVRASGKTISTWLTARASALLDSWD